MTMEIRSTNDEGRFDRAVVISSFVIRHFLILPRLSFC